MRLHPAGNHSRHFLLEVHVDIQHCSVHQHLMYHVVKHKERWNRKGQRPSCDVL